MKYCSMKCSYGVNEYFYKRKSGKHDHGAQSEFIKDAKKQALLDLAAAGVAGVKMNELETTQPSWDDGDPGEKYKTV